MRRRTDRNWMIRIPSARGQPGGYISTRTPDRAEAERIFEKADIADLSSALRADAVTESVWRRAVRGKRIPVCEARDLHIADLTTRGRAPRTVLQAAGTIDRWIRSCGAGRAAISSIQPQHVGNYVNRPSLKIAYSTRCQDLENLSRFFDFCMASGWVPVNPCMAITVRTAGLTHEQLVPAKKVPFTDDEIARILAGVGQGSFWYGAVLLGKHFGLRLGAVAGLEWASLATPGRIEVFTHKGRVVVSEALPDELIQWFAGRERTNEFYCFPYEAACIENMQGAILSTNFARICKRIGIVGKSFHCLRVGVVTRELDRQLEELGGPQQAILTALITQHGMRGIQRLVGHAQGSGVTASRYFNPQPRPSRQTG